MDANAGPAACRPHLATRAVHMDELPQIGVESIHRLCWVLSTPRHVELHVNCHGRGVEQIVQVARGYTSR